VVEQYLELLDQALIEGQVMMWKFVQALVSLELGSELCDEDLVFAGGMMGALE
jgi:hypothetical protein